jgi:uncharacterized protein involved in exopolysaccharide biosynthesis
MNDNTAHVTPRISLYDIVVLTIRRWWIGVICVGIGVSLAAWMAFNSPFIYRAEAVLMLAQAADQGDSRLPDQLGGLAALAGVSLRGSGDRKAEALATLQSRTLTDSFVRDRNLLPVLFASRWDDQRKEWKPNVKAPTVWDANELISRNIRKVMEDRKTGLVTVAMEWTDPKLAAEWTIDLVERTNRSLQEAAYARANRNIEFLRKQLEQTNIIEVRQALNKLMESELKTSMLAQRSDDYAFKFLDRPVVPEYKVRPRRLLILVLGFTAGIFAWILALVASEIFVGLLKEHRRARMSAT